MPLTLVQIVPPTDEPVSLDEMKRHLRVTIDQDDLVIFGMIQAAREHIERVTRRQFLRATYLYAFDTFPASRLIVLPRPPLVSIVSVSYFNTSNVETVFPDTDYDMDNLSEPGRLYLLPDKTWPSTYNIPNAVRIRYRAGRNAASGVAPSLRSLLMLMVGHLYEHREATIEDGLSTIPLGFQALMWSNRVPEVF